MYEIERHLKFLCKIRKLLQEGHSTKARELIEIEIRALTIMAQAKE